MDHCRTITVRIKFDQDIKNAGKILDLYDVRAVA